MSIFAMVPALQSDALVMTFLDGKSPATREAYRQDLRCFERFLAGAGSITTLSTLFQLTSPELNFVVIKYRDHLVGRKLSPATVNRRLGAVRSLFNLARLLGQTGAIIEIQNIKSEPYRDTRGPGLPAFKRMVIAASSQNSTKAIRDQAILRLLFDLALRASELVNLDLCHVDLDQMRISIKGKGRLERQYLSIPPTSIDALTKWIKVRGSAPGPLFTNLIRDARKRARLSRVGLYELVRSLGEAADIRTRPHGIRHLSISEACRVAQNNGYALEEVMDHSRHRSVATLMIYRDRERNVQGAIATLVANTIISE